MEGKADRAHSDRRSPGADRLAGGGGNEGSASLWQDLCQKTGEKGRKVEGSGAIQNWSGCLVAVNAPSPDHLLLACSRRQALAWYPGGLTASVERERERKREMASKQQGERERESGENAVVGNKGCK